MKQSTRIPNAQTHLHYIKKWLGDTKHTKVVNRYCMLHTVAATAPSACNENFTHHQKRHKTHGIGTAFAAAVVSSIPFAGSQVP
jgi:hypothetical protein